MELDPTTLIASGVIVIFLVEQLKRWVPTTLLPLVSIAVGVAVQLVNDWALAADALTRADVWVTILTGAGVGMVASGAYDVAGRFGTKIPPATIELPADAPSDNLDEVFGGAPVEK